MLKKIPINYNGIATEFKKPSILFLIISSVFCLLFLQIVPPAWGLDEQAHTARVYQIADGVMYPIKISGNDSYKYGGMLPVNLVNALNYGWGRANSADRDEAFYEPSRADIISQAELNTINGRTINDTKREEYNFGPTGPYSPFIYIPASIGMKLGMMTNSNVSRSIIYAKTFQALMYIGCVFMALRFLDRTKIAWMVFLVALLPSSIFQAITLNADAFTNAVLILFFALIVMLYRKSTRLNKRELVGLAVASALVGFTKPSYALVLCLVVALPSVLFASRKHEIIYKSVAMIISILILTGTTIAGMSYSSAILSYFAPEQAANISLGKQLAFIITHPLDFTQTLGRSLIDNSLIWLTSAIGTLGYNTVTVPSFLVVWWITTLTIVTFNMEKLRTKLQSYLMLAVGVLSALAIVTILYATFNQIDAYRIAGVQGRYFIPCMPFVLLGLAGLMHIRVSIGQKTQYVLYVSTAVGLLVSSYIAYRLALF